MAKDKNKKSKKNKDKKSKKLSAKKAAREAKKAARKGDGSFPDIIVLTKAKDEKTGEKYFVAHDASLDTLYKDGQSVGVYKLRRASTVSIKRKIALNRG